MAKTRPGMAHAERLEAMVDELAARLTALPEDAYTRRASEEEWTAAEVVGHVIEVMSYWPGMAAAIAAEPGLSFGRDLDDPDRIGAVRSANDVPRTEALTRLRHATHEAANSIRGFDTEQWETSGMHRTRGPSTVGQVVDELLIEHVAAHVHQALDAAGAGQTD